MSVEGIKEYIVITDDSWSTNVVIADTGSQGAPGPTTNLQIRSTPAVFPIGTTGLWIEIGLPNNGMTFWVEDGE